MTEEQFRKLIGKRIAAARSSKGWTLDALAERSKVGRSAISNYEQGARKPGLVEITALAKALGEPSAYLMGLESEPSNSEIDHLPEVFQDAIRIQIARYSEMAERLPVTVLRMFQRPTSQNYFEWELAIEESYRRFSQPEPDPPLTRHKAK